MSMRKVTLEGAIRYLAKMYGKALTDPTVYKPVSYALYKTAEYFNEIEPRREYKGGRRK